MSGLILLAYCLGKTREEGSAMEERPKMGAITSDNEETNEAQNMLVQNDLIMEEKSGIIALANVIIEETTQNTDVENEESVAMIEKCEENSSTKDKEA